jgi:hypothetical protein
MMVKMMEKHNSSVAKNYDSRQIDDLIEKIMREHPNLTQRELNVIIKSKLNAREAALVRKIQRRTQKYFARNKFEKEDFLKAAESRIFEKLNLKCQEEYLPKWKETFDLRDVWGENPKHSTIIVTPSKCKECDYYEDCLEKYENDRKRTR